MRVDPGKSSEPNWQRGWRTWTFLCDELYSATWLLNFQELVCSNQWLSEDAYLGISSEYFKNSPMILKYLICLFQSSCDLEQTNLLRSYNLKSILTVMMNNKEYFNFVCLWQWTAPVNRSCLLVEIRPFEMMLCIRTDKLSGIAGRKNVFYLSKVRSVQRSVSLFLLLPSLAWCQWVSFQRTR